MTPEETQELGELIESHTATEVVYVADAVHKGRSLDREAPSSMQRMYELLQLAVIEE